VARPALLELELVALPAQVGPQAPVDHQVRVVYLVLELLDRQDQVGQVVRLAPLDPQELTQQDPPARVVLPAPLVQAVLLELMLLAQVVRPDRLDLAVQVGQQELILPDLRGRVDHQVHRDHLDLQDQAV
jgi:hypothetical protein